MSRRHRLKHIGRQTKPGAMPGQVVAPEGAAKPEITVFAYDADTLVERRIASVHELAAIREHHEVTWIDVSSVGDSKLILELGQLFDLHRLALEDVVNLHQRPKSEDYESHMFLVARMPNPKSPTGTEQVSFFLGNGFVISFQSLDGDCFDNVRQRIRSAKGRIRSLGADYLCYALLDTIVDSYFPELERLGETLEGLEEIVVTDPKREHVAQLHDLKRELLMVRRAVWPHREMLHTLIREEHHLVKRETQVFLRDCYDHTIQLMDIVETYREIASGLVDIYISSVSTKLNEIMKVLTVIATIFMPLGFIASLYGMNFDRAAPGGWNMPELGWTYGYPFALLLMAVSAGGLLWYFYRNGWMNKD